MNGNIVTKRAGIVFLALAGMAFSPLHASDLSYSYVEAYYVPTIEGAEDGFMFRGSYQLMNNLYVGGGFTHARANNQDADHIRAFAGYIHPLNDNWGANLQFSIYKVDINYDHGKDDDDVGFALTGGVRGMVTSQLEAYSELEWSFDDAGKSKDEDSDDSEITIGARYYLMPNLSAGVEARLYLESLGFGARFTF
ncbi:MAG: outer membrane beta-barrel protein [Candidatus Thiodiazotropha sp.]